MDEMNNLQLWSGDTLVLDINMTLGNVNIYNETLVPWTMKDRFRKVIALSDVHSKYDDIQRQVAIKNNTSVVQTWLASRTLALSRKNAKWIYNLLKLEQLQDEQSKAKVALMCGAVSVLDNYWVKLANNNSTWDDVNIRHNHLNEVIAQVALHGTSLTLQGSLCTPELTTNGTYAKAWRRYENGQLWLHKAGSSNSSESRIEVMCSNLLDKMNVSHCHYEMTKDGDLDVCACPAMTSDDLSILDGIGFSVYCNVHELDYLAELKKIDADGLYKMWIVDYILCNRDRHGQNWGLYYDPVKMEFISMHPLFDHNNAFDIAFMQDREAEYQFNNMTIRQAAKYAITRTDFHFTDDITREDFITDRQWKEFSWRVKDLGIKTIKSDLDKIEYF